MSELTILQYAKKRGINKAYISRIVRQGKLHLLDGVQSIEKRELPTGQNYYVLIMKTNI
jgi:hypothetical protein